LLLTLLTLTLAGVLWMLSPPHPEQRQLGYRSSTFALQMVRDWPSLTIVLATPARAAYRLHTLVDFAFILAYGTLWIAMAFAYGDRAWLRWIAGGFILAAILCDVAENIAILRVLGIEHGFTDEMALAIRSWALNKWVLLMLGWLGLSAALLTHRLFPVAIGYLFAAGVIAAAMFTSDAMLELAGPVMGVTLGVQAVYFIARSGKAPA
jgi:hypothetical protein